MSEALRRALASTLGREIVDLTRVPGGDINEAFRAQLSDGSLRFVKTRAGAPPEMYAREAEGLAWLAEVGALRVPKVELATREFLVLEWIEARARARDFEEQLGRGLARVHQAGAPTFGLARENFIGSLGQSNRESASWPAFYWSERLKPLLARAGARGLLAGLLLLRFEELRERLPELAGPDEPPSRLHGDLWSGNVHCDERGAPVLIDPAVYGGHREMDLAMLSLFGSPSERLFRAYDEVYPRAPRAEQRVALCQLYPLLVHVCLFGASYVGQLKSRLEETLSR
ncbi:MAG: fructosamine kinase family protein [Myxococcales bacterium]